MKQKYFISLAGFLLALSIVLFFIQNLIVNSLSEEFIFHYPVWKIYVFHFFITFFIFALLYYVGKLIPDYIGFTFMGFILLKMIAALFFLLPLIKMENLSKIPDFTSFFIPYFIFLFLEILLTMKILKHSEDEE